MTLAQDQEVPCPECAATVTTTIWSSLNVTEDPQLKEDLFKGEINRFRCPSCGFETHIAAPLLYDDMEIGYMVQFNPPEALENESFYEGFTPDGKMDIGAGGAALPGPHAELARKLADRTQIVFSMAELVRYVTFRERLSQFKSTGGVASRSPGLN